MFQEHLGLTPDQLARSRRTHFARRLLDTDLPVADVAFATAHEPPGEGARHRSARAPTPAHARLSPSATVLAAADLGSIGPECAESVHAFARAVGAGEVRLDGSMALHELITRVSALAGFDPTAAQHLAMRLGERDAFPAEDAGLRRALWHLDRALTDEAVVARSEIWKPWRALAAAHLIAHAESLPDQGREPLESRAT